MFDFCQIALFGSRLRVDAEPDRKIDADRLEVADRDFADDRRRFLLNDELREADLKVACSLFEEQALGFHRALGWGRRVGVTSPRLPPVVHLRRFVLRGDDRRLVDGFRREGWTRSDAQCHYQKGHRYPSLKPNPSLPPHPKSPPIVHHLPNLTRF